jgi:RimJ/RimL family protein N-acetyltransferase
MRQELETQRLRLRRWRPDDLDTLVRWGADASLMRHMGKLSFTDPTLGLTLLLHVRERDVA